MQTVSDNYKNLLNNDSLAPKYKIVVDDVEYLGNVIMAFPKISHSNTSFIGGFPSKTCSFTLYNPNNDLNFENKKVTVYKGFTVNGTIEWVKQGVFIPQAKNITNEITTKMYIVNNASDKRQLLDVQYKSGLDWSTTHTGLEIVNDALSGTEIILESDDFNWANYSFNQPNFPSNATKTEVINRIAEIGGEIAFINGDGNLSIKGQTTTGDTVGSKRYTKLTKENTILINTLVLGKKGANDDFVYKAKNLFNKNGETVYSNATTITPIENGLRATATVAASYLSGGILVPIDKVLNKTVTLSATTTPSASNDGIAILYWLDSNYEPSTNVVPINSTANSYTYQIDSIPDGAKYLGVLLYANYTSETVNVGDYVDYTNIQLEVGEIATSYENFISYEDVEFRIEDNPYVDLNRANMIELVAPYIIGKSYTPFELTDFVDGYIYDLNDVINVVDKNGDTFAAVILEYENTARIRSKIKAQKSNANTTNYKIAGSIKEQLANVRFDVDHINEEIRSIVSKDYVEKSEYEEYKRNTTTQFEQTSENFTFSINNVVSQMTETDNDIQNRIQEINSYVRIDGDGVVIGKSDSDIILKQQNNRISFIQNNNEVAYISNNELYITDARFLRSLRIGNFAFVPRDNGNLSLVYRGGSSV